MAEERAYTDYPNGCHELEYAQPITIGDNCWLCASVTVCGGVTIGAGSIIAAGAVVTRDIPPNSIAAGVPAQGAAADRRGRPSARVGDLCEERIAHTCRGTLREKNSGFREMLENGVLLMLQA